MIADLFFMSRAKVQVASSVASHTSSEDNSFQQAKQLPHSSA